MTKIEQRYDYIIPILYESKEEEKEAQLIGFKDIYVNYGKCIGKNEGNTLSSSEESYKKIYGSGEYILWKQMRKNYVKHLDENPFEIGDQVKCIANSSNSSSKQIGNVYTIIQIENDRITYKDEYNASYKDFKLNNINTDTSSKDWRDAFLEDISSPNWVKSINGTSMTIRCERLDSCNKANHLLAYVSLFELGGFWLSSDSKLEFLISSMEHPKIATYEHAKKFVQEYKDKQKLD